MELTRHTINTDYLEIVLDDITEFEELPEVVRQYYFVTFGQHGNNFNIYVKDGHTKEQLDNALIGMLSIEDLDSIKEYCFGKLVYILEPKLKYDNPAYMVLDRCLPKVIDWLSRSESPLDNTKSRVLKLMQIFDCSEQVKDLFKQISFLRPDDIDAEFEDVITECDDLLEATGCSTLAQLFDDHLISPSKKIKEEVERDNKLEEVYDRVYDQENETNTGA